MAPVLRRMLAPITVIGCAGAVCGILDGLSAIGVLGVFGIAPGQVFRGIARGVLGPAALTGGHTVVAIGVIAHFSVAIGAAAAYYLVSRWIPAINDHAILAGAAFGAAVHVFMNFVLIPLSRIGPRPIVWPVFLAILAVHLVVVGPSISLTTRWFARHTPLVSAV